MKIIYTIFLFLHFCSFNSFGQEVKLGMPTGHTDEINSIKFSKDGEYLLFSSQDNTVSLFETKTGKLVYSIRDHNKDVNSVVFSHNNKYILTASADGFSRLYDFKSGNLIRSFDCGSYVWDSVFSTDDEKILVSSQEKALLFKTNTGELLKVIEPIRRFSSAYISPNDKFILTISRNKAKIWDIFNEKVTKTLTPSDKEVFSTLKLAIFDPNAKYILTARNDGIGRLYSTITGEMLQTYSIGYGNFIKTAKFSPDGKYILISSHDTSILFNLNTGKMLSSFETKNSFPSASTFSPSGKYFQLGTKLYETNTGNLVQHFQLEDGDEIVNYNVISPNEKYSVIVLKDDYAPKLYEIKTGKLINFFGNHSKEIENIEFNSIDNSILINYYDDLVPKLFSIKTGKLIREFKAHSDGFSSATLSNDGRFLITTSYNDNIKIFSTINGDLIKSLVPHKFFYGVNISPNDKFVLARGNRNNISLFDFENGKLIRTTPTFGDYIRAPNFSPDSKYFITTSYDNTSGLYRSSTGESLKMFYSISRSSDANFSPDSKYLCITNMNNVVKIYNIKSGKETQSFDKQNTTVSNALFSKNGDHIIISTFDNLTKIYNKNTGSVIKTFNNLMIHPLFIDENIVLFDKNNNVIKLYNIESDSETQSFLYWDGISKNFKLSSDSKYFLAYNADGGILLFDKKTGKLLIRKYIFDGDSNKWLHLHPSGLFDASPEAMKLMYYTYGLEIIEFEQLKDRYWKPGLWEKVMKGEELRDVRGMDELKLWPEIDLGEIKNYKLPIKLTKRDGGYGKVSIFINGKETINDARGSQLDTTKINQTIHYDFKNHPFLKEGENEIVVKASSADGFVVSRGTKRTIKVKKEEVKVPQFFGVVIGVEKYANKDINLSLPEEDALAISKSITLGAHNLFSEKNTHIYSLTTKDGNTNPNKENIKRIFDDIATKAKSEDIIFIYLSGHGITWGKDHESDFYYLTSDAVSTDNETYNDEKIRKNMAISSSELVEWIKNISALKQVMIIDACGSGKAVDNLSKARSINPSQLRALDRMKDRTGMFIISGSAADAVSYEASIYGQGLLTYSILQAMRGAALKENRYVDISNLMEHALESVPKLAKDIGGIQTPHMLKPSQTASFDIGILNEDDKENIPLNDPKQIYVRTNLVHKMNYGEDPLNLSGILDNRLALISSEDIATELIFFDTKDYPGACKIVGGYTYDEKNIDLDIRIRYDDKLVEKTIEAKSKEELIDLVLEFIKSNVK